MRLLITLFSTSCMLNFQNKVHSESNTESVSCPYSDSFTSSASLVLLPCCLFFSFQQGLDVPGELWLIVIITGHNLVTGNKSALKLMFPVMQCETLDVVTILIRQLFPVRGLGKASCAGDHLCPGGRRWLLDK